MSTPKYRSGFTCRAMRMYASLGTSESTLAHLESCASCRQYFRAGDDLESALRRGAADGEAGVPAGLERGILRAVRTSEPSAVPTRSFSPLLAGVAALVAAVATVFISRPAAVESRNVVDSSRRDVAAMVEVADAVSDRFWASVMPSVGTFVEGNPLPRELSLVYADAQRALDFLALNFLPSTVAAGGAQNSVPRGGG